jgi:hypothetical protein
MCAIYHGILKKMQKEEPVSFETPIRIYQLSQKALLLNEDRVPDHAMKAYKGSRGIAPLILKFVSR